MSDQPPLTVEELRAANQELQRANDALRAELGRSLRRVEQAREDERRRIARDIHDHLGQQMTALRLDVYAIRTALESGQQVLSHVARAETRAAELDAAIENVTRELRPATLDLFGLPEALRQLLDESADSGGLSAVLEVRPSHDAPTVSRETSLQLFRIAQEGLHNVQKHARARSVRLILDIGPSEVQLTITDDGRGFALDEATARRAGLGLVSMRERAVSIGGTVDVESTPGAGVTIRVRAPLGPDER